MNRTSKNPPHPEQTKPATSAQPRPLARKISKTHDKLEELEESIDDIGDSAAQDLRQRLDNLKIEERALERNYQEAHDSTPNPPDKLEKVESLLGHVEREQKAVEREAKFRNLCAPSTSTLTVESGAKLLKLAGEAIKRLFRGHKPWRSPFVNRSHKTIAREFDLKDDKQSSSVS